MLEKEVLPDPPPTLEYIPVENKMRDVYELKKAEVNEPLELVLLNQS